MPRASRRNSALKYYVNGKAGQSLHGLADAGGRALAKFDIAVQRAKVGLKRRALPAVSRAVRENYSLRATTLTATQAYKVQEGAGGKGDYLSIWASTRKLPLVEFGGRWSGPKSPGATAEIVRGKRKTYTGAFIAKGRFRGQQRPLIYTRIKGQKRLQTYGYHKGKLREPIRALRGPSPFEMVSGLSDYPAGRNARQTILAELTAFYTTELQRQFTLGR